jgi:Rrf2 family transcriptional regulator, nitric oxide-sensitive transcriptional repressor
VRLTLHADYSLRLLMYLAARPDRLSTVGEVADAYGISANHLMKVSQHCARLGYVETARGRRGGIRLGRAPATIRIGQLLREIEGALTLVECFEPAEDSCPITPICALKPVLHEALEAFLAVLDRYTLADLTANRGPLVEFLRIAPAPASAGDT